jgi:hypothetical protein
MKLGSVLLWTLAGASALVGCATAVPEVTAKAAAPSLSDLIVGYRNWHKVNSQPFLMSPAASALCISVAPQLAQGPHESKYISVYVNSKGKDAMLQKISPKFPEGSVIVKEKLPKFKSSKVELLTVMVKRNHGFDVRHGDWEYFTANGEGAETSQENVAKCQSCHESKKSTDYVFRSYVAAANAKDPYSDPHWRVVP